MKVFFRRIHLYLSFAAGLVILVACLTGAILVFEKELMMAANKDRYYVKAGGAKLSADSLVGNVKKAFPQNKVNGIRLYAAADRSAEVSVSIAPQKGTEERRPEALKAATGGRPQPPQRQPGFTVFVNPYTGAVLEKYAYNESAFYTVFALHRWLLGGNNSVGKYIVGISTFIFLFILITGIILWWPKTRRVLAHRLKVKWHGGWRRLNHDLHVVLGFYSAIFLFIFAFTGLAWSFEWFNDGIYKVTGSPLKPPPPPKSNYVADAGRISLDHALVAASATAPGAAFYNISMPKDSTEAVTVSLLPRGAAHEAAITTVYIDQYSGAVLGRQAYSDRSTGARVRSAFKPVHTGSIWGAPSKIIAFITCLLGVTFPITGTIMWWKRTQKKRSGVRSRIAV